MIEVSKYKDHKNIILKNEFIEMEILPEIGGKIHKIRSVQSGFEFLLQSQKPDAGYNSAYYGANFEDYDTSGFDECFPTVSESEIELKNGNEIVFPDHGELWSRKWDYEIIDEKVKLQLNGVQADYLFTKIIELEKNNIIIKYSVENRENFDFQYLWSAHPLLNVSEGDEIVLPSEVNKLFLNWSSDGSIGSFGEYVSWPKIDDLNDFSNVRNLEFGKALKLFSDRLNHGLAGCYFRKSDESLLFEFDVNKTPYLGLWLTYGGWPENALKKHLTVGIEPTNGRPDCLKKGIESNEVGLMKAGETNTWDIKLSLCKGKVIINK